MKITRKLLEEFGAPKEYLEIFEYKNEGELSKLIEERE